MNIIKAQLEHIPDILRVISACVRAMQSEGIYQWDEIYPNEDVFAEDVRNTSLYVAEFEGICVGAICLDEVQPHQYSHLNWSGGGRVLVIHRLCVDPARQGQGIARRILDFAEETAKQSGYRWIRLEVFSGNLRAVGMYERRGYKHVGEIWFPRREEPYYCLEKSLE